MAVSLCQADIDLSHQEKETSVEELSPSDEPVGKSSGIFLVYGWYGKVPLSVGCAILGQAVLSGVRKQVEQATESHMCSISSPSWLRFLPSGFCMMMDCNP